MSSKYVNASNVELKTSNILKSYLFFFYLKYDVNKAWPNSHALAVLLFSVF